MSNFNRPSPRLAARAIVLDQGRLLLVNAWPGPDCNLWCAPGGGVEPGQSLPDNLRREVLEETGLEIEVGLPCLVNEFHDPGSGFHQVEIFFRCALIAGTLSESWQDPEGIVNRRQWVAQDHIGALRVKPDSLAQAAWGESLLYDPFERLVT